MRQNIFAAMIALGSICALIPQLCESLERQAASEDQYKYLTTEKLSATDQLALIESRKAVWVAWFAGDESKIKQLMPEETIVADPHDALWIDRSEIINRSAQFAATKGKLTEIHFPENRLQVYGDVVVLYVNYTLAFEIEGETTSTSGRATEVFVKREGKWLNTAWHLDHAQ